MGAPGRYANHICINLPPHLSAHHPPTMRQDKKQRLKNILRTSLRIAVDVLAAPWLHTPCLMTLMTVLQLTVQVNYYCIVKPDLVNGFWNGLGALFVEAYVASWTMLIVYIGFKRLAAIRLAKHAASVALKISLLTLAYAWLAVALLVVFGNWLIDLGCMFIYGHSFTADIAAIIAATNPSEGSEFISSQGTPEMWDYLWRSVAICTFAVGVALVVRIFLHRYHNRRMALVHKWLRYTAAVMSAVCIATLFLYNAGLITNRVSLRGKLNTFLNMNMGHDIVPANPRLTVRKDQQPARIVIIVGESLGRDHCQLYGYGVNTQPRLQRLVNDSLLTVFDIPTTPGTHTMEALQQVLGAYEGQPNVNWYECPTVIEVARLSGYRVNWLSNQSSKGIYDNPLARVAKFCDHHRFTNNGMRGMGHPDYDEALLPMVDSLANVPGQPHDLTFIHLMGSHQSYDSRYPSHYDYFNPGTYTDRPGHQRYFVAQYDNSVLYNDYVVSTMMNAFSGQDAIVIYFSDHAQDLYVSDEMYRGHARNTPTSQAAGSAIPLVVYMSPVFRELHPEVARAIENAAHVPGANTTNLIYSVMDLMGSDFADDPGLVSRRSFLRIHKP